MAKKVLAIVLAVVMCVAMFVPTTAMASELPYLEKLLTVDGDTITLKVTLKGPDKTVAGAQVDFYYPTDKVEYICPEISEEGLEMYDETLGWLSLGNGTVNGHTQPGRFAANFFSGVCVETNQVLCEVQFKIIGGTVSAADFTYKDCLVDYDAYEIDNPTDIIFTCLHTNKSSETTSAATCTEAGELTTTCTSCGESSTSVIPALGHTESDWIVDKAATETTAGSKHTECTVCGETLKTEEIPATGSGSDEPSEPVNTTWDFTGADGATQAADALANSTQVVASKGGATSSDTLAVYYDSASAALELTSANAQGTTFNGLFLNTPTGGTPTSFNVVTGTDDAAKAYNLNGAVVAYAEDDSAFYGLQLTYFSGFKFYHYEIKKAELVDNYFGYEQWSTSSYGRAINATSPAFETMTKNGEALSAVPTGVLGNADVMKAMKTEYDVTVQDGVVTIVASAYVTVGEDSYVFITKPVTISNGAITYNDSSKASYTVGENYENFFGVFSAWTGGTSFQIYSMEADYGLGGEGGDTHEHNYTSVVTDPTCTDDGYTTYTCECGDSYVADEVAALGHDETTETVDATCTEAGTTTTTCSRCDYKVVEETPALGHDESTVTVDATCDTAGSVTTTCSRCDYKVVEEIPATGHSFSDPVVTKEATCTEPGVMTGTCTVCGKTTEEAVPALGHDEVKTTVDATCTEAGSITTSCSRCDYKAVEETPALGHDLKTETVDATCTAEGSVTTSCSRCDYSEVVTTPAAGHNFSDPVVTKEATCTEPGIMTGTCTVCGETTEETIPALGHDESTVTVDATCTEAGSVTTSCSRCDYKVVEEIPALGHTESDWIVDKAATETEAGSKHTECTVCGETLKTETIPATGSGSDEPSEPVSTTWDFTGADGATQAADAIANATQVVASKGGATSSDTLAVYYDSASAALELTSANAQGTTFNGLFLNTPTGGTPTSFNVVTGTDDSTKAHNLNGAVVAYAEDDSAFYGLQLTYFSGFKFYHYEIKKAELVDSYFGYEQWSTSSYGRAINATSPVFETMTKNGETLSAVPTGVLGNADVMKAMKTEYDVTVQDGVVTIVASAYVTVGEDSYVFITKPVTISNGAITYNDTAKASYTVGENYENFFGVFSAWTGGTSFQVYSMDADYGLGGEGGDDTHTHDYTAVVTAPTCTEAGYTTYTCECGDSYVGDEVAALGHDEVTTTVDATCTEAGSVTTTCSRCDYKVVEEIPATGHSFSDPVVTKEATCTEAGEMTGTCTVCGETTAEAIPALGHDTTTVTVDATCETAGSTTTTCSRCDYKTVEEIAALGHDTTTVTVDATCETAGSTTTSCSRCDYKVVEEIAALGHNTTTTTVDATCTADGSVTTTCSRCDYKEVEEIAALGHDLSTETVDATCTEAGSITTSCSRCDYKDVQEIPAKGHTESGWIIDKEATATEEGSKHTECTVCGATIKTETIPALGVEDVAGDGNGDGTTDVLDAILLAKRASGIGKISDEEKAALDVNGDGKVNMIDSIYIARFAAGVITEFPVSK